MSKQLILFLCISFVAICSCKKKEKGTGPKNAASENVFRLKHNGTYYSKSNPTVGVSNAMVAITAGTIDETGNYYQIAVKRNLLPGTYQCSGNTDESVFLLISDQRTYVPNYGTITILSSDPEARKIEYEFTFEMIEDNSHSDTIQITEGYANVSY